MESHVNKRCFTLFLFLSSLFAFTTAQSLASCSPSLTPTDSIKPSVASGYEAALVATGLNKPRSIQFDSAGNLLVIQSGNGALSSLQLQDNGGVCLSVRSQKDILQDSGLNHGLAFSQDGKTVFASTQDVAYSWDYDAAQSSVSQQNKTLVTGMKGSDHSTRTLLVSQKEPSLLLISRGSQDNVDLDAEDESTGISQIRAFNTTNMTESVAYNEAGLRLGWGLRNSVGVAEHPITGGIYSVENSVDNIEREGKDVHQDNPGEEMNFHGYLNGTEYPPQGSNYGYPTCFAAWGVDDIPDNDNLKVGSNFAMGSQNSTVNDTYCGEQTPPRLTFQAHMAPIDLKFNDSGNEAWVTFRGSWDRSDPVGYKISLIPFVNGEPVAQPDNNTATVDIMKNMDNSNCPDNCFRPTGMAFDSQGRLFVASDASGELYVIARTGSGSTGGGISGGSGGKTSNAGRNMHLGGVGIVESSALLALCLHAI